MQVPAWGGRLPFEQWGWSAFDLVGRLRDDVDFEAAKFDAAGKKQLKPAYLTVKLNGFLIHDRQPVEGPTGGGKPVNAEPGPMRIIAVHTIATRMDGESQLPNVS